MTTPSSTSAASLIEGVVATFKGLDLKLMTGILLTENAQLSTSATSNTNVKGLFQIEKSTWDNTAGLGPYDTSIVGQTKAACTIMLNNLAYFSKSGWQQDAAILGYSSNGYVGANAYIKSRNSHATLDEATAAAAAAADAAFAATNPPGKGKADPRYLQKVNANMGKPLPSVVPPDDTVDPIAVKWEDVSEPQIEESALINQELVITDGIDNLPWYKDPATLIGNRGLLLSSPAYFTINLKEFDMTQPLPNKAGGTNPLVIRLNCGLSDFNISMKHIVNKSNTRTGFHMTFWGMEPDTITGSGSTGIFLNRTGVTDMMSLDGSLADNSLYQIAHDAYGNKSPSSISGQYGADILSSLNEADSPLKVAAQDAFIELLATFRNNGIIRYINQNYDNSSQTIGRSQIQNSVWSEKYGGSSYTRQARVNDVMVKGNVVLHYRSNIYHGYFKTLSWVMDAEHPFHWKFDFTFQVQKSISQVFYPAPGTAPVNTDTFD